MEQVIQQRKQYWILLAIMSLSMIYAGCNKFLDEKPKISIAVPQNLTDLQTLLDNSAVFNGSSVFAYSELVADNYYVKTSDWQRLNSIGSINLLQQTQNYIWQANAVPPTEWNLPYQGPIYYSNIVLDQLPLVAKGVGDDQRYSTIKGSALFYRAFAFYDLAQLFCKPYSQENAGSPGIILKLSSNVGELVKRATVQQTYDQIINDLKQAATLLPTALVSTRPTQTAAYAELARVYLSMRDYVNAGHYADLALRQKNTLMDYNTLVPVGNPAISANNPEVLFVNHLAQTITLMTRTRMKIDSSLYQSYDNNDLRKVVFFKANTGINTGTYFFQASYYATYSPYDVFNGLTTDEMYLIRAECVARAGNKDAALTDLNTLMVTRWKNSVAYPTITASDANDALTKILVERRKELVWRGIRWSDIRRLNLEGANITLVRIIGGVTYTLPPNDLRSVLLIPQNEIDRSAIQQNPR